MFKQFAIARFMIGFIVFILAYMVASLSYDVFFHFLTAGMFILSLWVMYEAQLGHKEELAKKDLQILDLQDALDQKESEVEALTSAIHISKSIEPED